MKMAEREFVRKAEAAAGRFERMLEAGLMQIFLCRGGEE